MQHSLTSRALEADWFGEPEPERARDSASRSEAAMRGLAEGIRPPSQVVQHVLSLCADPSTSMGEIRETVETDPALASLLMQVANSAAMSTRTRARSLDDAVVRLGTTRLRGVVSGLAALGSFSGETPFMNQVRQHSARVAAIAERLGREWRMGDASDLFLAGLVHDIGVLVLVETDGLDYPVEVTEREIASIHYERDQLGFDHAALGRVMLEAWRFPADLVQVVDLHHDPARAYALGGAVATTTALLRLADAIDDAMEREDPDGPNRIANGGECSYLDLSEAVVAGAWPALIAARDAASRIFGG